MKLPYEIPSQSSSSQEMLLALLLAIVGSSWVVTQRFAARLAFDPRLGEPWLRISPPGVTGWVVLAALGVLLAVALVRRPTEPAPWVGVTLALPAGFALASGTVYAPFLWLRWRGELVQAARDRADLAPVLRTLDSDLAWIFGSALGLCLLRLAVSGSAKGDTQGSARFATSTEIGRLGLRRRATGVVVGGERRFGRYRLFFAPDRRHVGIFGPSGCGKTTKVVIPTLLRETASMVVLDIKMELYAVTAAHRAKAMGHTVHAFAPSVQAPWVSGYNPLLDIPKGPMEVAYAQALAQALVDPEGQIKTPDFWQASAQSLLTAAILHTLYARTDKSLAGVQALLASGGKIRDLLGALRDTKHDPERLQRWRQVESEAVTETHPVVWAETGKLIDLAEETLTGIVATAQSKLSLFLDPILAENTRRHSFSLAGLGNPARPTTIYLIIPARDIARLSGLLRLFLQFLSFHLTASLAAEPAPDGNLRPAARTDRNLVLLLDELAAVGRLDLISRQIAYLRGYGIQVVSAVQTANQLYEVYGQYESLRGNLAYLLAFPSTEQKTSEEISRLLGDQTLWVENRTRSSAESVFASRRSVTVRDHKRPLLTPDEVRRLPNENPLLFVTGAHPIVNGIQGFWRSHGRQSQ